MEIKQKEEEQISEILIGENLWQSSAFLSLLKKMGKRFALITDSQVKKLWGEKLEQHFKKEGLDLSLLSFAAGEESKTRETKQQLEDALLAQKQGRESCLIALGGGVVTDLVGFIASTFCRGVPYVSLPTTLLGMVDASLGGKTGVNTSQGKNLIGAYYPPKAICMDLSFLSTLSEKEWRNGAAEILKYGLIGSPSLFASMRDNFSLWQKKEPHFLKEIISASCLEKKRVVELDFREKKGVRRMLNFGHTFGHAIETLLHYQIGHGDAVALGMAREAYLSQKLGYLSGKELHEIVAVLRLYQFSLDLPEAINDKKMEEVMALDKKAAGALPRFVLLKAIGEVLSFNGEYCTAVAPELLREALSWRPS